MSKYGSIPTKNVDFSNCERPTPSYSAYPIDYPYDDLHTHSGKTLADAAVLNDTLVCIGHGRTGPLTKARLLHSPEDYDGIKIRKNEYEDALAKVSVVSS
jgi:histone deacetylase complex regulatory component SIN3